MARRIVETTLPAPLDELNPKDYIIIKGAKAHNLKGLSVALPRNKLIVITGLSGSGKSSLAFDTLFAEGQRMYVETLSSYARQFVGRMEKPEVDYIRGVSPAIAIEQKVSTKNPRSTVGTSTEIYDYLKLFFARIGKTYSPSTGEEVRRETVTDVVNYLNSLQAGTKAMIICPLKIRADRTLKIEIQILLSKGYPRLVKDGEVVFTEDFLAGLPEETKGKKKQEPNADGIFILIDRAVINHSEEESFRLSDSVQTAFFEGEGYLQIWHDEAKRTFSDRFEAEGISFDQEFTSDLFIIPLGDESKTSALTIAQQLRSSGLRVEISFGDRALKGSMKAADKSGAAYVIVLGESEISSGTVELKEMSTGKTSSVTLASLQKHLLSVSSK
jgi:excinuclease ABC subunit A